MYLTNPKLVLFLSREFVTRKTEPEVFVTMLLKSIVFRDVQNYPQNVENIKITVTKVEKHQRDNIKPKRNKDG